MQPYIKKLEVRWADLDPNFHMLHSRYYDFGAYCRMSYLVENGITPVFMQQHNMGPIIFREECIFKKEIGFEDDISINVKIQKMNHDCSRWSMVHEIWKDTNTLAAVITCDGAWIDTKLRKLAIPPAAVLKIFQDAPRTDDFMFYQKEE